MINDNLLKACRESFGKLDDDNAMIRTERDAGLFVTRMDDCGPVEGYQVFVKVCRWSRAKLEAEPLSGGLLGG